MKFYYFVFCVLTTAFGLVSTSVASKIEIETTIEEDTVERYDNQAPKSYLVYKGPAIKEFLWTVDSEESSEEDGIDRFVSIISARRVTLKKLSFLGFKEVMSSNKVFAETNSITSLLCNSDQKEFIMISFQENQHNCIPMFKKCKCSIDQSILDKDKWVYPKPVSEHVRHEEIFEMSWRFVDGYLHREHSACADGKFYKKKDWEELLYNKITKEGLENSIAKIALSTGSGDDIAIWSLDKEKSLINIKEKFSFMIPCFFKKF